MAITNCLPTSRGQLLGGVLGGLDKTNEERQLEFKLNQNEEYQKIINEIFEVQMKIEIKRKQKELESLKKQLGE